ncbi:hypothetical protein FHS43_000248 [Streptosporangium becharense]|uniref:Secreted protein n=1 Tax=Streptosporangium becharense TaxID=1816182 RepID=A0A7W9IGI6_9ACTN|nr:hypothetical protein [Streptosporangium becharense]MBB2909002.1 hypothetical protein [Streptosporangium becharense]MBB5819980.1 hypothetical protein [Streptosporangium becharense]
MSNTSRNIRGLLAVAALTVGANWTMIAPASAEAALCGGRGTLETLQRPGTAASFCEEIEDVRVAAVAGGTSAAHEDEVSAVVDRLARIAGLPGLSRASAVVSFADAGGVAAGLGCHALPFGLSDLPEGSVETLTHPFPDAAAEEAMRATGDRWPGTLADTPELPGAAGGPQDGPDDGPSWMRPMLQASPDPADSTGGAEGTDGADGTPSGDVTPPLSRTESESSAPGGLSGTDLPEVRTPDASLPETGPSATDRLPAVRPPADLPAAVRPQSPALPQGPATGGAPAQEALNVGDLSVSGSALPGGGRH